jgi:hypothetical protein
MAVQELRELAADCAEWAAEAESDGARQVFLHMARDYTRAAAHGGGTAAATKEKPDAASYAEEFRQAFIKMAMIWIETARRVDAMAATESKGETAQNQWRTPGGIDG